MEEFIRLKVRDRFSGSTKCFITLMGIWPWQSTSTNTEPGVTAE
jgi:hypothetical protein